MIKDLKEFYRKIGFWEKWLAIFVILGVLVTLMSLFRGILESKSQKIEYIEAKNSDFEAKIVVDIGGAVNAPGVYELASGSRVKDVLVMAGGYGEKADRVYCEKMVNLASTLKDGQKIYIPFASDTPKVLGYVEANKGSNLVNINTATDKELDTLWGIGEARIDGIVKNRPYQSVEELVSKKVLTKQILEKNKDKITVY